MVKPAKRSKYNQPQPQLTDLNYECMYEIFGHLNIDDLDHVSQLSESCKSVADRIVTKKFDIDTINTYNEMKDLVNGPKRILRITSPLLRIVKLPSLLQYKYTKDLHLNFLRLKDHETEKLFTELINLEAITISHDNYALTRVCLKPLKNLKSARFTGVFTPVQEFKSFLRRNQSLEVLGFVQDITEDCANKIAKLKNLHTFSWRSRSYGKSINLLGLEVAKMTTLRKVSYSTSQSLIAEFLHEINGTNVVEELEICGTIHVVPIFPQNSNIKVLRLQSNCVLRGYTKVLQMNNLEELTLDIIQSNEIPENFIEALIKNLPKLKKLELKAQLKFWIQPHDEIEKVLRQQNRKLEIRLYEILRPLIKWSSSEAETCLQFTFDKDRKERYYYW